ncbi:MAG TPA: hypothetical protein QF694_03725 [Dehalococcoidia bacterium]|nr:hypothetical protein [Dehalococcoidia bacterium]HJP27903.1 hypothetical protein [Dehalococcoidia bacterium]
MRGNGLRRWRGAQISSRKIYELGAEVGKRSYTLVTGIALGLPHGSVLGAKS